MSRLAQQAFEDWVPIADPQTVAVLDRTVDECAAAYGWCWNHVEEAGLGPMSYVPLAWDGQSRFLVSASGVYPNVGIAVEASKSEDPAAARADLRAALDLEADAFLAISEGNTWFARWDPPHNAGVRPSTARPR